VYNNEFYQLNASLAIAERALYYRRPAACDCTTYKQWLFPHSAHSLTLSIKLQAKWTI